jgi:hypothetical protein
MEASAVKMINKDVTKEKESENTFYLVFEVYHNLYVLV